MFCRCLPALHIYNRCKCTHLLFELSSKGAFEKGQGDLPLWAKTHMGCG